MASAVCKIDWTARPRVTPKLRLGSEAKRDMAEVTAAALAGDNPAVHESVLLGGWHAPWTGNPVVLADWLHMPETMLRAKAKDHAEFAELTYLQFDDSLVNLSLVAWAADAFDGHASEFADCLIGAGYSRGPLSVGTQKELAEALGVCEKTVQRAVAGGLPHTVGADGMPRYGVVDAILWKRGLEPGTYSPPGQQTRAYIDGLIEQRTAADAGVTA